MSVRVNVSMSQIMIIPHSVHWGINPPLKTPPPLFLTKLPLNQQTVQAPFLGNRPLYIGFL